MVNPSQFLASLMDGAQPFAEGSDGNGANPLRAMVLGNLSKEAIPNLSDTDAALLTRQTITDAGPGTILQDFDMLLEFLGPKGITVSGKRQQFPMQALADINNRLSKPITLDMKRPQQKSYPPINALYLLLRATGLVSVVANGKKQGLVVNQTQYETWKTLNPTERYFTLLEAWLVRGQDAMMGEERPGPLMDGDRCFKAWEAIVSQKQHFFAKYTDQNRFNYYPGFHSLALMEMFGFLSITSGIPHSGKGWRIESIEALPFGNAMMALHRIAVLTNSFMWKSEHDVMHPYQELQPFFSPYFPEWQTVWSLPQAESRTGRRIFKVHLGKCWRRIAIDADATLYTLSRFILDSVDFDYDHLDQFTYKDAMNRRIEVEHPQCGMGELTTDQVKIGDLPVAVGSTMEYLFDFGDCWTFQVQLEAIESLDPENIAAKSNPKKSKKSTKDTKKTSKQSKHKSQGDIIESHGNAPEQYPSW